jgi:hypothetical protein
VDLYTTRKSAAPLSVHPIKECNSDYFDFDRVSLVLKAGSRLPKLRYESFARLPHLFEKARATNVVALGIGKLHDHCLGVIVRLSEDNVKIFVILQLESHYYAHNFERHPLNAN